MTAPNVGQSLSPSAIRDIVQRYGALVGMPRLAPHDLRRTFASRMLDVDGSFTGFPSSGSHTYSR